MLECPITWLQARIVCIYCNNRRYLSEDTDFEELPTAIFNADFALLINNCYDVSALWCIRLFCCHMATWRSISGGHSNDRAEHARGSTKLLIIST
jgi:hypothetical protein